MGEEEEEVGAARLSCDAIVSCSSAMALLAGPEMLGWGCGGVVVLGGGWAELILPSSSLQSRAPDRATSKQGELCFVGPRLP